MIKKIRNKFAYDQYRTLYYSNELSNSYLGQSITGNSIEGKRVLITGGTGDIGIAMALRFINEGCIVIISARNEDKAKKAVAKIKKEKENCDISYVLIDHLDIESINIAICKLFNKDNGIDILINNAGVFNLEDRNRMFRKYDLQKYNQLWDTNFKGTVHLTNGIAEAMNQKKIKGNIINIASICGIQKKFQYTPYGMSKAAIIEYTSLLNRKYKNLNIHSILPGSVATKMGNIKMGDNISSACNKLNRLILPEEIAALTAFLCSDCAVYIVEGEIVAAACEIL